GDIAIVLVEQFYEFAEELADNYTVLSRGKVVSQGAGDTMVENNVQDLVAI
ncbi:ABC transporter ATP-binding protein, partial [Pseudomonas sp. SIMBA_065]